MAVKQDQRWMMFVDGENLTIRGREILGDLLDDKEQAKYHRKDTYLWPPKHHGARARDDLRVSGELEYLSVRSYYYTAVQGNEEDMLEAETALVQMKFQPRIFKKPKNRPSKGVDISITVDALHHAQQNHYDVAVFVAGDKDYIPLLEAVKRHGKRVIVSFFAQSTPIELKNCADEFIDFMQIWKELGGSTKE